MNALKLIVLLFAVIYSTTVEKPRGTNGEEKAISVTGGSSDDSSTCSSSAGSIACNLLSSAVGVITATDTFKITVDGAVAETATSKAQVQVAGTVESKKNTEGTAYDM